MVFILPALMAALALACAAPFGLGGAPTPTPAPADRTAQLSELQNQVDARSTAEGTWAAASEGQTIRAGGGVQTGDDSRARVDTSEGSIIRLAANTQFELLQLSPTPSDALTRLKVEAGKIWIMISAAAGFGQFEVETPSGVATVRGSLMSVEQAAVSGRMLITCLEGTCRLSNPASGAFTDLAAGEQSEIAGAGQDPQPAQPMDQSQIEDWLLNFPEAQAAAQRVLGQLFPTPTPTPPPPPASGLSSGGAAQNPRLIADGFGVLHVMWESSSLRPNGDYLHRQRESGGQWSEAQALTADFDFLYGSLQWLLRADGAPCALWNGATEGSDPDTIGLYQRCQAGGAWSPAEKLTVSERGGITQRDYAAVYAVDRTPRAVYVVGAGTLYFGDTQLSDDDLATLPRLVVDAAGGYHVAWTRLGDPFSVEYRYSSDGGSTWTEAERLSDDQSRPDALSLSLVADRDGIVHLAWGGADVFYRRWSPATGWGNTLALAGDERGPGVSLAVGADGLARAVWWRSEGVFYARQTAEGTWGSPQLVATEGRDPVIAVDEAGVSHIAWLAQETLVYASIP